jgi:flagellar protein FliO/FliZ
VLLSRRPRLCDRAALLAAAVAFVVLAPGAALAAFKDKTPLPDSVGETGSGAAEAAQSSGGSGGALVRMIVGLLIVIAVIYGVYWLLKTWNKSKNGDKGDGRIELVTTTALAQNRSVHLLRVGDELVLVGSAEHGVTPIRVYSAEEARKLELAFEQPDMHAVAPSTADTKPPTIARLVDDLRRKTAR